MNFSKLKINISIIILIIIGFVFIYLHKYKSFSDDVLYSQYKLKNFTQARNEDETKMISRERALKLANNFLSDALGLEYTFELKSISLEEATDNLFLWNISLINRTTSNLYTLAIDSHTGKLIMFESYINNKPQNTSLPNLTKDEFTKATVSLFKFLDIDISKYKLIHLSHTNISNQNYQEYRYLSKDKKNCICIVIDKKTKQIYRYALLTPSLIGAEDYENIISGR